MLFVRKKAASIRLEMVIQFQEDFRNTFPYSFYLAFLFSFEIMLVELACNNERLFPIAVAILMQTSAFMENKCWDEVKTFIF